MRWNKGKCMHFSLTSWLVSPEFSYFLLFCWRDLSTPGVLPGSIQSSCFEFLLALLGYLERPSCQRDCTLSWVKIRSNLPKPKEIQVYYSPVWLWCLTLQLENSCNSMNSKNHTSSRPVALDLHLKYSTQNINNKFVFISTFCVLLHTVWGYPSGLIFECMYWSGRATFLMNFNSRPYSCCNHSRSRITDGVAPVCWVCTSECNNTGVLVHSHSYSTLFLRTSKEYNTCNSPLVCAKYPERYVAKICKYGKQCNAAAVWKQINYHSLLNITSCFAKKKKVSSLGVALLLLLVCLFWTNNCLWKWNVSTSISTKFLLSNHS